MCPFSSPCDEILLLAVPFLGVLYFSMVSQQFRTFLVFSYFSVRFLLLARLYLTGEVAMQGDMWRVQILTFGSFRHMVHTCIRILGA
jgi:hypothetical protein